MSQTVNMSIDRKRRHAERLSRHNRCCLVAHTRESLHLFDGLGYLSAEALQQLMGEFMEILRFRSGEPDLADVFLDLLNRHQAQSVGVRRPIEEGGSDLVHLFIGGLRGEKDRYQKGERVSMIEWHRCNRVELLEYSEDPMSFLFLEP